MAKCTSRSLCEKSSQMCGGALLEIARGGGEGMRGCQPGDTLRRKQNVTERGILLLML